MNKTTLIGSTALLAALASPVLAADLSISVEIPRVNTAAYHRPYVAIWIEQPDQTALRTLAVWYQVAAGRGGDGEGKDWLKDLRTWWRKGGRALTLPADGLSGATRAPGTQTVRVPAGRLTNLPAGQYNVVIEAAREQGGREIVRVPFRWGGPAGRTTVAGSTELGAVTVIVTR